MNLFVSDVRRTKALLELQGVRSLKLLLWPGLWASATYRFGHWANQLPVLLKVPCMALYTFKKLTVEVWWGISISAHAKIGSGMFINHFGCIFVHGDAVIGKNVVLSQEVTIGVKADTHSGAPTLGDNVVVGAGAKVLGCITLGNNVTVGANAVVVKDVPADWVVGGVPAERIR